MDCCNYMSYKNHYYGTQQYFEQMPQYHGEYYNNPTYSEYYGNNTPYYSSYPWQHCNTASFPDYTYNPKEARIRKAMRDANRERAMGVAPATRGGRRSQPWVHPETDDHFMMTPSHGMRGVVGSPMCGTGFPIGNVGNGQFIQPMHSYNKHMHLISHDNNGYLQPNPMAQLQHQTDMWNQYQHSTNTMRPTPSEYVMPNSQMPNYHHQQATEMHQTNEASSSIERVKIGPETFAELSSTATSPHTNENVPPNHNNFEGKIEPLMESTNVSQAPFMNLYQDNVSAHSHFDKNQEKVKKHSPNNIAKPQKSLPDFNEAFGSTERGRFQSPPDPRLPPKQGYLDFFITNNDLKFDDYHI
ncbi:PREDICTED: uncharacterized protein LOC108569439 isoform X2 [Nicrophorus vespilloides]|uniref:Uncharacterized protein LOC108569439 isoform X2 n=1 Tax=Nicrophorus vespilloides TaxID=110193 RepID=A0ABM1NI35_NICVS|nr:PREDICTED: uncharacterized protein LOC108569439 isoform X2 [Nicrophorus vespilloides]